MSLILEALRRSEAERRRGEAPDVLAPVEVIRPRPAPGLPQAARWGLAGAAVALALGLGWWQWRPTAAAPVPSPEPPAPAVTDTTPGPAPIAASPIVARKPAPPVAASAAAPVPVGMGPAQDAPPAAPPSSTLPASAEAPAIDPVIASSLPARPERAAPTPPPPAAPAASAQSTEFLSPEATVRLAELSSEERKQLPALKISMHMWAPDRASRFVIIDGARLAEGDRVADATVSAILADGVTLAWRGRQIRLPIR